VRGEITGSVFDGCQGGDGREGRLAGLRLEPKAESSPFREEVTRATQADPKPAQPPEARAGDGQDRQEPEEYGHTEKVGDGEQG
jgi:hypothetical protein